MFETLGFQELVVILIIAVFIFGPSKIPAIGRGLGEGIRNFKKGLREASWSFYILKRRGAV
ncbi:MAG TPA: twin-arginine translocase TatA/TatE family subunit [Acidobacteriota bacterium]|jgi:sec-independent protein translocase protein TatA|nr:twin-arginine translocase TatA/TatE family subunit [Acidobacteriota bacterium]